MVKVTDLAEFPRRLDPQLKQNGIVDLLPAEPNSFSSWSGLSGLCYYSLVCDRRKPSTWLKDKMISKLVCDMLRVGSHLSLLEVKARGADVRILYSP